MVLCTYDQRFTIRKYRSNYSAI